MKKFKKWLFERFLPAYCKENMLETNDKLVALIAEQKAEIDRLQAYISGLERAMRTRITIKNEVSK